MYHAIRAMRRRTALATAMIGVLGILGPPPTILALRSARAAAAAWDLRQISADERRRLLAGEIIPLAVAERTDRDLAAGVMAFLPLPLTRVGEHLAESELAVRDPGVTRWGGLPERAGPAALAGLRLGASEADELLVARPGSLWNLSSAEMDGLRSLRLALEGTARSALAEAASVQYRALMLRRTQAYRAGGLGAIEPYARRGGGATDPGAELRLAVEDARPLADASPTLPEALLNYPAVQHAARPSQLYWVERRLQGRVTPVLVHQLMEIGPELALHVERHFFVGHSYNSSQTLTGGLPWGSGSLLFVVSRVSTDLVTGLGGDVKRAVGRRQMRGDLTARLDRFRAGLIRPQPPQSP
jgi:hypothetical protein